MTGREPHRTGPDWGNPVHLLAFGLGAGAVPKVPGTAGTLVAVPVYWLIQGLGPLGYLLVVASGFLAGVYLCDRTSRDLGVHDHTGIVWDEMLGFLVTMWWAPTGWIWVLLGFLLFRIFDILKPWPIGWLDRRVPGGLGIMLDDVLAGIFALAALQLLVRWFGTG
jgi:phosphatidylglycerophosphatase A